MKRKTKKENKDGHLHWTAFDEPINGPSKARSILDLLLFEVEHGTLLSLRDFQKNHGLSRSQWQSFYKKYPFFCNGIDIIKAGIYSKRFNMVVFENAPISLMRQLVHYSDEHYETDQMIKQRYTKQDEKRVRELQELEKELVNIKLQKETKPFIHMKIML